MNLGLMMTNSVITVTVSVITLSIIVIFLILFLLRWVYKLFIEPRYRAGQLVTHSRVYRDYTTIYQGLYRSQIDRYSSLIKYHVTYIRFIEIFRLCFPDGLITTDRIRAVLSYLIYNIPSVKLKDQKYHQIIPKGNNCISIQKTINQLANYLDRSYLTLDQMIGFHQTMDMALSHLNIRPVQSFNHTIAEHQSIKYFNRIDDLIIPHDLKDDIQNIRSYIDLYHGLCRRNYEVIDLTYPNTKTYGYTTRTGTQLRLFVRIPTDIDLDSLSKITARRSIINPDSLKNVTSKRVKVLYPMDNEELEQIITYLDTIDVNGTTPIIIAQIASIFPTYDYNGTDLNIDSNNSIIGSIIGPVMTYHTLKLSFQLAKNTISQGYTFSNRSGLVSESSRNVRPDNSDKSDKSDSSEPSTEPIDSKDHPYQSALQAAVRVFDFIKDSGLGTFGRIDIELRGVMSVFAPRIITIYDRLDLYPQLGFKLINPICYPQTFHRIYVSLRASSENDDINALNPMIKRIRQNSTMMNVLNDLSLIDMYVDLSVDNNVDIHPILTNRVRVIVMDDESLECIIDQERLNTALSIETHISIKAMPGEKLINKE